MKSKFRIKRFARYTEVDWDKLLLNFDSTINYTFWFLNYVGVLNHSSDIKNFTFVLYESDEPIAIVPLYLEKINCKLQISMGQEPVFAPIFNSNISIFNSRKNFSNGSKITPMLVTNKMNANSLSSTYSSKLKVFVSTITSSISIILFPLGN